MGFYAILLNVVMTMVLIKIRKAKSASDFGKAGTLIKWLMLFGIISMILIPFS